MVSYTALPENPLPHWELARKYDIIDFDLGVKLTGAGFPVYKGKGARLQRALINSFLDCNTAAGYLEVEPPVMVNEASGFGTGQLPDKGRGGLYPRHDEQLLPRSRRGSADERIYPRRDPRKEDFPVKMTRLHPVLPPRGLGRTAGRARTQPPAPVRQGGDRAALAAEKSYEVLDGMVAWSIVTQGPGAAHPAPVRRRHVVHLGASTYDFEVSGVRNAGSKCRRYQFRVVPGQRSELRYRDEEKKIQLAHTLNGSSLALPRIVAALLENYQTPEGIRIPEALIPYTGFDIIK